VSVPFIVYSLYMLLNLVFLWSLMQVSFLMKNKFIKKKKKPPKLQQINIIIYRLLKAYLGLCLMGIKVHLTLKKSFRIKKVVIW
jgi:hypothetical protein